MVKRIQACNVFVQKDDILNILNVILSRFFNLILCTRYIPVGFKRNYTVPIPKPNDVRTKALTCNDFRGIAINPAISKVFEYCFLLNSTQPEITDAGVWHLYVRIIINKTIL